VSIDGVDGSVDSSVLDVLACPRDHTELRVERGHLICESDHRYPIVNGVPVFLLPEKAQTIDIASASLKAAEMSSGAPLYLDTLGLSPHERGSVERNWKPGSKIDQAISYLVGATSGWGYVKLIGKLKSYPIPNIPLEDGDGELLLDVGSSWGRWSVSAARKGWRVIAIDPSLGAIMAAQRAFADLGLNMSFVCGDARFLPFKSSRFRCVFSYSVMQHFSESDAELAIAEMARVLLPSGFAKIQMAHKGGLRSAYHRIQHDYSHSGVFRVRYWSLASMRSVFERHIGPTDLKAEAFGGLGLLGEDWNYVSIKAKVLITFSLFIRELSRFARPLILLADSIYVISTKR